MNPELAEPNRRAFPWSAGVSLLLHLALVAAVLLLGPHLQRAPQRRGEPITVELARDPEPAPRGNPGLPVDKSPAPGSRSSAGQGRRSAPPGAPVPPPPRVAARSPEPPAPSMPARGPRVESLPREAPPKPDVPVPTARRLARAPASPPGQAPAERPAVPPARPAERAETVIPPAGSGSPEASDLPAVRRQFPARPEVPRAAPPPPPAVPPAPEAPVRSELEAVARTEPAPSPLAKELPALGKAAEGPTSVPLQPSLPGAHASRDPVPPTPGVAAVPPSATARGDRIAALPEPGRGGGLRGGRGGVEGEPVPLDSRDPRYSEYLSHLRRQIQEKWAYPREAAEREEQGQLVVEIGIAKDGRLAYLDLRRSSGVRVLDSYAMNAVKLAQPFPPVPDRISLTGFPVTVVFNYILEFWPLTKVLR